METTQVAFIRGFVEKCASRGWQPQQISEALSVLQMNEMAQDPDFAAGFNKQANGLTDALGSASTWMKNRSAALPGEGAMVLGIGANKQTNGITDELGSGGLALGAKPKQHHVRHAPLGVNKQANGLTDALGSAGTWLNNQTPASKAMIGAGVGGLGGLAFGGKHKLRNALLGATLGGGAGYGLGKMHENGLMAAQDADIADNESSLASARQFQAGVAEDAKAKALKAPFSHNSIPVKTKAIPDESAGAVNEDTAVGAVGGLMQNNVTKQPGLLAEAMDKVPDAALTTTDDAAKAKAGIRQSASSTRGAAARDAKDTTKSIGERIEALSKMKTMQGKAPEGASISEVVDAGVRGLTEPAKAVAKVPGVVGEHVGQGLVDLGSRISDSAGLGWQKWNDADAKDKLKELEDILSTGRANNVFGADVDPVRRAKALQTALDSYKKNSIGNGNRPAVQVR